MKLSYFKKLYNKPYITVLVIMLNFSCVEPINVKTLTFEDVLVVEALITNEYKTHQIKLSNSYKFEEEGALPETNAFVVIRDDLGGTIQFHETFHRGLYESNEPFNAEHDKNYQLTIVTADGETYESTPTPLTNATKIDNLYAERGVDVFNTDGIHIFVDSYDPSGNSKYYKYEFEETYKIVAPYWVAQDMVVENYPPFSYYLQAKSYEQKTCYNSIFSNDIIQTETTDLLEDHVQKFSVRFIPNTNAIMGHRYSVLVKQYVQSLDAYTYYKTLKKMSSSQTGLTQNQPGFIQGNIYAVNNPNEKVIGIFEVSSVTEKRMFFNYRDFYVDEPRPPYFVECKFADPKDFVLGDDPIMPPLQSAIYNGLYKYYRSNPDFPDELGNEGKYLIVPSPCGDCTKLGTNIKPDFWYE